MWVTFAVGRQIVVTNQTLVLEDSDLDAEE
ncbi:hypothetical protein SAMN04490184_2045 [Pseudomonas extremorientalis]|uniref:Uncharacterized protein n=2 Tax=Pseudomonas extremorientalis TaxID=169669 RepID=A0ABY0SB30_9PSED|nr:hypothetical protein SAMN04490184_2045 [Pseudomonas extremorientalis]